MPLTTLFHSVFPTTVVLVGVGEELVGLLPSGTEIVRLTPTSPVPRLASLLVLDARVHARAELEQLRSTPDFASVPTLLLSDTEDDGTVSFADDVLVTGVSTAVMQRRLRLLLELGRNRILLSFAQQALDGSVSGLTISNVEAEDAPLVHVSPAFEAITGYTAEEAIGRNCRFLQRGDSDGSARRTLRQAVHDRSRARVTLRNYRKDGTPFWNQVTLFPMNSPSGERLPWMGGVQHDVTAQVEARAEADRFCALLIERQLFDNAILDGIEVGIITTDEHGHVTFLNRAGREILDLPSDAATVSVTSLLGLGGGPDDLLATESRRRWLHTWVSPEGAELDLELSVSRAEGSAHDHIGFFFIFRDLTEEKQREMERRRFERLAAMGTMVAGFAHEVRNPVASLRSLAESLDDDLAEQSLHFPHVKRMLHVLERMERLVRTSLSFGTPSRPRRRHHKPWTILSTAISALHARTRELGDELRVEVDPDLPEVCVDEGQVTQVLVIMLNNALDATGSPKRVLMRCSLLRSTDTEATRARKSLPPPSAAFVRFEVTDDGPGIPPEIIGRIVDPFFTTKASGTGLGLSIAQQLIADNGGRLDIVSTLGGPTTFAAILPCE